MHNELFNPIDIFTYHPAVLYSEDASRWTVLTRDLFPEDFLDFIWTGCYGNNNNSIKQHGKAVGFKSFPEHWSDVRNDAIFKRSILEDFRIRKIILQREDELAVYVSMLRTNQTGSYLTYSYPPDLKLHVDPAKFQAFVDQYRMTYAIKYKSPMVGRDSFHITYEQMVDDEERFAAEILPELYNFLGVDNSIPIRKLKETVKQANPNEDLSTVIENYDELEFCFRHTSVLHFINRRRDSTNGLPIIKTPVTCTSSSEESHGDISTWSILLPICSRGKSSQLLPAHLVNKEHPFNVNRFLAHSIASQHGIATKMEESVCWTLLQNFCQTLAATSSKEQLRLTEVIVGIDIDDPLYSTELARDRVQALMPCLVKFVTIQPDMYGKLCRIWNLLANQAKNDYVVLFGDDIRLMDYGWQAKIVQAFHQISQQNGLPLGAACVAMNDLSFPGFPTFPVVHRWHIRKFGTLLPKQFVNQGGDPWLYELYSRFNAATFVQSCRLENIIGGDDDARYRKYHINWRSHILSMSLRHLATVLGVPPKGVVLDVVVPSFRTDNSRILECIASLRSSVQVYVKFWIVVDNPSTSHVQSVKALAERLNNEQLQNRHSNNYFINVIHYGENRGASYARNTGFNYSTADYVLFLDDDVIPDENLLDAYVGAIRRYPDGKVYVGCTDLPEANNRWTEMLRTCNVGYFYSIATKMTHPPWGVTANLMVRGARHNPTIQFKTLYPKTGGGEDIDFVYQFKSYYPRSGLNTTVAVPEAKVQHPWWRKGDVCYSQIIGWATGDSLCITEWPEKTFLVFPNWIEHTLLLVLPTAIYIRRPLVGFATAAGIVGMEHLLKTFRFWGEAGFICGCKSTLLHRAYVALGAGSVISAQEVTRTLCAMRRLSLYSLCRRVDWFDGQQPTIKLDIQLVSAVRFAINLGISGLLGWHFKNQRAVR